MRLYVSALEIIRQKLLIMERCLIIRICWRWSDERSKNRCITYSNSNYITDMDNPVFAIPLQRNQRGVNLRMNVLEKILEEIEHEAMTNKEIGRKQCEGMARAINIVSSHLNEFLNCDIGKNCHVYDIDKITTEEIKPISKEYIDECKEVSKKYKKNTGINNKCSDCSRRKWYQIGYSDAENINIEKIKAINKEMEDYLFEKYCIEGFDEVLDGIFKKYLDLCNSNFPHQ